MGKLKELLGIMGRIEEMANTLLQKYTGIPGKVWIQAKDEVSNSQAHALGRVKLMRPGKEVSVSIKKNNKGVRISHGKDLDMIEDLTRFIEANEKVLWDYWETPGYEADFQERIPKLIKV